MVTAKHSARPKGISDLQKEPNKNKYLGNFDSISYGTGMKVLDVRQLVKQRH
jgi:hypothetical protein